MRHLFSRKSPGFLLLTGLLVSSILQAQLINQNGFLQGQFVEVGIAPFGTWGTMIDAPSTYHARSGTFNDGPAYLKLGFVADPAKDGWDSGFPSNYEGDYFLPNGPLTGFGLSVGATNYFVERSRDGAPGGGQETVTNGHLVSVVPSNGGSVAVWEGSFGDLFIRKTVTVPADKAYFVVRTVIINNAANAAQNIYYAEYVNPDNDAHYEDRYDPGMMNTRNAITFQNPGDNQALVKASGPLSNNYLGLGSKDCRAKVSRSVINGAGDLPVEWTARDLYEGITGLRFTGSGTQITNENIAISFNIGSIDAGDSTAVSFTYILAENDLDEALLQTDPVFEYAGSLYVSGDTISPCPGTLLPINISNGDDLDWTWVANPHLDTLAGTKVMLQAGAEDLLLVAAGIGACGNKTILLNIQPDIPLAPLVTSPVDYCQHADADPLSATGNDVLWYDSASGSTLR